MNGPMLLKLQERNGVRATIESVDHLRILNGFDNVRVMTPKVEIRMRSGYRAKVPLRCQCTLPPKNILIGISYPDNYPIENFQVELLSNAGDKLINLNESSPKLFEEFKNDINAHKKLFDDIINFIEVLNFGNDIASSDKNSLDSIDAVIDDETEYGSLEVNNDTSVIQELEIVYNVIASASNDDTNGSPSNVSASNYACRGCRTILFTLDNIISHNTTTQSNNTIDNYPNRTTCTSYFLKESLSWMQQQMSNEMSGKLYCNHCKSRLGAWDWSGLKCSCGTWVTPAFQFTCSKIDEKR